MGYKPISITTPNKGCFRYGTGVCLKSILSSRFVILYRFCSVVFNLYSNDQLPPYQSIHVLSRLEVGLVCSRMDRRRCNSCENNFGSHSAPYIRFIAMTTMSRRYAAETQMNKRVKSRWTTGSVPTRPVFRIARSNCHKEWESCLM
ncbi:uncharacterized protein YALI1_A03579g [Yarrowia lipolytica]|uniref:Uncharacterized protein n=1 Tax=Yarrowia lipolytica TaxID=4952 RepID=A0A1D8N3K0_YARLL|nr:hypothetical protein YALI1_A03579g [Yarrowia lipolytica]